MDNRQAYLSQNIDDAAADGVGVAVAIGGLRGAAAGQCINLIDRLNRAVGGRIVDVSCGERAARLADRGDVHGAGRASVVRCDANIHAQILDPLWRMCKRVA